MYGTKAAPSYGPDTPPFEESADQRGPKPDAGRPDKTRNSGTRLAAVFVRHGDTQYNKGEGDVERVRGQANVPLDADGRKEAVVAGRTLAQHGGVSSVQHTHLDRGRDTAKAIADATGAKLKPNDGLLPWDKGDAEGKPIEKEDPKLRVFATKKRNTPVPGGESFNAFTSRTDAAARSVVKAGQRSVRAGKGPVAAVNHSVEMRRLPHLFDGKPEPDALKGGVDPGGMIGVTMAGKTVKLKPGMWGSKR